ncbi:hypothetical protein KSF_063420 [Reticulibacter mediterranei]|uniref:TIR domain-containing protein n=1 Tax=Reticulibacter mediterranei TaxID=2778369 RepID=A0A8J3N2N7_9CHLR|nr:TIR domain-containing protein [Reticulibacter mediterranei]GHO96294.1 hypothetical protein KSF_063420 [Reticulibacter mediterranei]
MAEPVQLYICYAEENKSALSRLEKQLTSLIRTEKIQFWHRDKLLGGDNKDQNIMTQLDRARIILMLVSADLFGEYYNSSEMQHAFRLHKEQKINLVPIIVGSCNWQGDRILGGLVPLPRTGNPTQNDKDWSSVVKEIIPIVTQIQSEQAPKEPIPVEKSSSPKLRQPRKPARPKPQQLSGAALTTSVPTTNAPPRSTSLPASTQPDYTLPAAEEPEPRTTEAGATTPTFGQGYNQAQNGIHQVVFTILIWEPSQSTYDLIANERRAIYHALLNEQHQCILGGSLLVPEGQSLQDREISQAYISDNTVVLIEPEISPISEWQEFYNNSDDDFRKKALCYYPETAKAFPGSWKRDETLYWLRQLEYYQEIEITNCQMRTKVLKFFHAKRLETYRMSSRSGRGR